MGQFRYKARNSAGKMQTGTLSSQSLSMAKTMLVRQRLTIMTLTEYKVGADGKEAGGLSLFGGRFKVDATGNMMIGSGDRFAVPDKDLIVMTKQLAVMLESGLPINQSLSILSQQQPLPQFGKVLEGVGKAIEEGNGLSSALGRYPLCFDVLYLSMVKAGEESGRLPDIMGKLLTYIEKSAKIKSQVKSAMMYPAIVLVVAFAVMVGLLAFVVPVFAAQFRGAGKPLPAITQFVVNLSDFVKASWWKMGAGGVLFYMIFSRYRATVRGRRNIDSLLLNLPVLGGVMRKIAVGRFCSTMGSMLTSGVNLLQALTICASSAGNMTIEEFVLGCKAEVETGKQLSQPLSVGKLFPKMVVSMIQVGEKAGKMDVMLEKIAIFYEEEVDESIKAMLSMIEPMMIVFIGIMVGFLVIAMYLPMMDLGSTVE
jgi:type IV pilus assembly protein PilC